MTVHTHPFVRANSMHLKKQVIYLLISATKILKPHCVSALFSFIFLFLSGCATSVDLNGPTNTNSGDRISKEPLQKTTNRPAEQVAPSNTIANTPNTPNIPKLDTRSNAYKASDPGQAEELSPIRIQSINADKVMEVQLAADLWERIRKGFAMPDLDTDLVRERQNWYVSKNEYLLRMTDRSSKYLYYIVEELEARQMPTELALLPFIESSFNPQAISSAKASGIWQFMPKTGKNFDLKQNAFRDDRRDVLASTRAALDYLQKLYNQFGDWHLALAAYNWGEGNVGKALTRSKNAGGGSTYVDLNMPVETRLYIPKLQAVKNIVASPKNFGITLPNIPNHPYFQTVPLPRDMDVRVAAHLADVSMDDFTALNPSAHQPVLLAGGTPQILLPWDNAEIFQRNYETFGGRLASWTAWVVPTTMKVSEAAKKFKMTEAEFRSINNIPPKMLIKAGSALLVPRGDKVKTDVSVAIADTGQVTLAPEVTLRKSQIRVNKKDTLESFATKHHIKPEQLAEWNKLSLNTPLKQGQVLIIFVSSSGQNKTRKNKSSKHH